MMNEPGAERGLRNQKEKCSMIDQQSNVVGCTVLVFRDLIPFVRRTS